MPKRCSNVGSFYVYQRSNALPLSREPHGNAFSI